MLFKEDSFEVEAPVDVDGNEVIVVALDMSGSYLGRSTETIAESRLDSPTSPVVSLRSRAVCETSFSPWNILEQNYKKKFETS